MRQRLPFRWRIDCILQQLTNMIIALHTEVDHTKLHTGYMCRSCVLLLEKYNRTLKDIGARLSKALPILPKLQASPIGASPVPICAPPEIHTQSGTTSGSPVTLRADTFCPAVTVSYNFSAYDSGHYDVLCKLLGQSSLSFKA